MKYPVDITDLYRFNKFFTKLGEDDCWIWRGSNSREHGQFVYNGKVVYAHRISFLIAKGEFDLSLDVLHSCDNGLCVNPKHLFLGTQTDNNKDMISKNRHSYFITEDDILIIRELYSKGMTQKRIARKFNISRPYVSMLVSGKRRHDVNV